uniref:Large ribosomal subunit protein uL5 n=1 Tax=Panthera tigris altaica TaxID=74533 RepID=A0A8C9JIU8_PANTA
MVQGQDEKDNPLQELCICKLCLNICVGESGERLILVAKVLELFTRQTAVFSKPRCTVRSLGIRRNEKIAEEILEKGLRVRELALRKSNFFSIGNFGFGIQELMSLGIKYDSRIGIYGLDFFVVLSRPGFSCVGAKHRISKEEAVHWFQQKLFLPGINMLMY